MFRYIQKISDKIAFRQQDIIKMLLCFVFLFFILHYLGHFSIIEGNRSRRNIRRLKKLIKSNKRNNIRLNKKIENLNSKLNNNEELINTNNDIIKKDIDENREIIYANTQRVDDNKKNIGVLAQTSQAN